MILADKLIFWALKVMPGDTPEFALMAKYLTPYLVEAVQLAIRRTNERHESIIVSRKD